MLLSCHRRVYVQTQRIAGKRLKHGSAAFLRRLKNGSFAGCDRGQPCGSDRRARLDATTQRPAGVVASVVATAWRRLHRNDKTRRRRDDQNMFRPKYVLPHVRRRERFSRAIPSMFQVSPSDCFKAPAILSAADYTVQYSYNIHTALTYNTVQHSSAEQQRK